MCASGSGQTAVGVLGKALENGGWPVRSRESGLLSVHPHSVWEPEGRVGLHPQSQAGWEGPVSWGQEGLGRLLASLSQESTCLPASHSSYSCSELTPAMLSRLRALRVPGDRLRQGH